MTQDGDGLSARSRQAGGRVWGLVVGAGIGTGGPVPGQLWEGPGPGQVRSGQSPGQVRSGQVRSGGSYGEGSRGRCGDGARRSPRARVRARRRCGEGRVEDTWRCSCTITGRCGATIEVSVRQVLHTVDEKPRSLRTPSRAIRLARQMHHAACSMMHDACSTCSVQRQATKMQLPPCTRRQHVGIDALCRIAPFGPAKAKAKANANAKAKAKATPTTRQRTHHGRF